MKDFIKISFRNLLRYKRRTFLTGISILLGGFILTFGQALGDGVEKQLSLNIISADSGHVLATLKNDLSENNTTVQVGNWKKQLVKNPLEIESVLSKQEDVSSISKRVYINGMLSNGAKTSMEVVIGIEPEKEQDLFEKIIPVDKGSILKQNNEYPGIYISHTVSDINNVDVGDDLKVITQDIDGKANVLDCKVQGIFKKSPLKEYYAYITLGDAQKLGRIGDGITQFKIMLNSQRMSKATAVKLQNLFGTRFSLKFSEWEAAGGFLMGSVLIARVMVIILCVILFLVVGTILLNTMSMAVFERTKEIGTIMAIGTKKKQVLTLFLLESTMLGITATGLGVGLGSAISLILGKYGIPAVTESLALGFGADHAYPYLKTTNVILSFLIIIALTIFATLAPAIKASRLEPVKALTNN
jgi:putative ABC transport system permease protein